ncbi:MAG TPA: hypothetical protein VJ875_04855 [Pyrinomonadaceae bacterium]|nr:hypothetical protein [Pyrinomonadaceae bacterium]
MVEFWADVFIHLIPTESGGRTAPLDLCNDRPGQYRPHLRIIDGSSELLGVAFMDGPDDPILPGGSTHATIKSLYEPGVSYEELVEGARFEILEGRHVVGYGEVIRRLS